MKIEIDGVEYLPAVDLSKLPTIKTSIQVGGYGSVVDAVLKSDLESIVPTKPCECEANNASLAWTNADMEKEKGHSAELEAKVLKLEEENTHLKMLLRQVSVASTVLDEDDSQYKDIMNQSLQMPFDEIPDFVNNTVAELESELSTIREQGKWELGEPLEPGYLLQPETRILKLDSQGKLWQMEWQMKINIPTGWICYLDPRPLPTLPEPVPEVPKFKGAVRNVVTGKIYYVLWPKGARPSLVSPDGHTLHYDGFPPNNHELYNHPEVPNTPELIAALEKKST